MANNQSVSRHLDAFTRGQIIGKLEEARVTSVAAEFELPQHRFTTLETISNYRNSYPRGFSSGRPRGNHTREMTGTFVLQRREETGGRQREKKSLDTRHRRLDAPIVAGVLPWPVKTRTVVVSFARRPGTVCTPLTPAHRRRRSLRGAGNTGIGETMNGDELLLTDESRFKLE
ncbi:transposable element Tc1 transposase [Trichonephila clavipes]|nr:transposable element Tc1 transposase [Trichonephila clavipes]